MADGTTRVSRFAHIKCPHGLSLGVECGACNRCRHGIALATGACPWCREAADLADVETPSIVFGDDEPNLATWREYAALPEEPVRSRRERQADEQEARDVDATDRAFVAARRRT